MSYCEETTTNERPTYAERESTDPPPLPPNPSPFVRVVSCRVRFLAEKAFVTGVEAANAVVERLEVGKASSILPLEDDEPHIQALRAVNTRAKRVFNSLPGAGWLLP